MSLFKKITTGALAFSLACSVAGVSAAVTDGGDAKVKVDCTNATCVLSVTITGDDFGTVPYNMPTSETATGVITVTASDDTGSGDGWHVTIYGEDFSTDTLNPFAISNLSLSPASA